MFLFYMLYMLRIYHTATHQHNKQNCFSHSFCLIIYWVIIFYKHWRNSSFPLL